MTQLRCPRCGSLFDPPARFCIKDGFPLTAPQSKSASWGLQRTAEIRNPARPGDPASGLQGRILDSRYAVEARVGEGGMAYVYRAKDRTNGETVAIKVLMSRLAGDPESVARLEREAKLAMKLNHPNVCRILALGSASGLPYLVMPFLDGETLSRRESRVGPMSAAAGIGILVQLCRGLQHAHDQDVLHRDLKPENVMLVKDPAGERAVVMDFGLAKERITGTDATKLTATGIVLGTPEFMSPEQIRGRSLDPRSDVYGIGVLGFELFTGELPFEGANAQATMLNHLTGQPRKLRAVRPELSPKLEAVIDRSLQIDPASRFATMTELAQALESAR